MTVLILNWNGQRYLGPCLDSVTRSACEHVEVIVVDNASTDDSVAFTKSRYPSARVLQLADNLGFGPAYNIAARAASGRVLVFLNNDTVVDPGWLRPLVETLLHDSRIGLSTSKVLFEGTHVVNAAGGQFKLWQGGSELWFGQSEESLGSKHAVEPFFASGCAMAIAADLFWRLGGFDSNLRLYAEDLDISWRARLAGFTVMYCPESVVMHHYSGTAGAVNPTKHRLGTTNTIAVMIKCLSLPNLIHALPAFISFAFAKAICMSAVERDLRYVLNVFLSARDTCLNLRRLMRQRRTTQHLRVAPDRQILASEGFGLTYSPSELLRILRQARRLNRLDTEAPAVV